MEEDKQINLDNCLCIRILTHTDIYCLRTRTKIDQLAQKLINDIHECDDRVFLLRDIITILQCSISYRFEIRRIIDYSVRYFLNQLKDDIHCMICNSNEHFSENYTGLDCVQDTIEEVYNTISLFPDVLLEQTELYWMDETDDEEYQQGQFYPISQLSFTIRNDWISGNNDKVAMYIPVLVKIALQFGLFHEETKGGLLIQDVASGENVLQNIMGSVISDGKEDMYLNVLMELRNNGVVNIDDVRMYGLLQKCLSPYALKYGEKRYLYLLEWDPNALSLHDHNGFIPLHYTARSKRRFELTFNAGIKYLSKDLGIHLLFHKNILGETPYQIACWMWGRDVIMKIVKNSLTFYSDTPFNNVIALVTAAVDDRIHLDCVYFLLRREPDILQQLV